jgi:hypothetical protein
MRKSLILVLMPAIALGGCALGRRAAAPDEFAVARNAPLVIPPDYTLTPPVAGTVTGTPQDSQRQAIDALFGGPAPRSRSETSLLEQAGRDRAALGVRSTVGDPDTNVIDMGAVTQSILVAQDTNTQIASAQIP